MQGQSHTAPEPNGRDTRYLIRDRKGWRVVLRNKERKTVFKKYISDMAAGSEEKGYHYVSQLRDEEYEAITGVPLKPYEHATGTMRGFTGTHNIGHYIRGITLDKNRFRVYCGDRKQKTFSVKQMGYATAYKYAALHRFKVLGLEPPPYVLLPPPRDENMDYLLAKGVEVGRDTLLVRLDD